MVIVKFTAADAQMLSIAAQLISYYRVHKVKHDSQYLRWYDYKLDEADEQEDKSGTGYVCSETGIHLLWILKSEILRRKGERERETLFWLIRERSIETKA